MKKICAIYFIFFVLIINKVFANTDVYEYYPASLLQSIENLNNDFNEQSLDAAYKEFIKHKGIRDSLIIMTVTDIALKNKDKINDYYISLIKRFDVDNEDKIDAVLSTGILKKIKVLPAYINNFSIYTIFKYVTSFFIILMLFYLFIKNKFMFFHYHEDVSKGRKLLILFLFIFVSLGIGSFIPSYIFPILAFSAILMTIPESNKNKIILFIFILIAIIFNQVVYQRPHVPSDFLTKIVYNPVSKNYLNKISDGNISCKLVKYIKYPDNNSLGKIDVPKNTVDKINLSIYYLMNNKFEQFKKIIPEEYLDDPFVLLNVSSYYFSTFQYSEMEKINKRLYEYPLFYRISEDYHQFTGKPLFIPYADDIVTGINDGKLTLNNNWYVSILLLLAGLIVSFILSNKFEIYKCVSCGDIFCAKCDDGFEHNQTCDACKNILNVKHNAEAAILVKKRIAIENYQYNLKRFSKVLSMFLPGAGHIYLNKHITGSVLTLFFSIILFIFVFRYEPFMSYDNIAVHVILYPFYLIILSVFVIIYFVSIFYRK